MCIYYLLTNTIAAQALQRPFVVVVHAISRQSVERHLSDIPKPFHHFALLKQQSQLQDDVAIRDVLHFARLRMPTVNIDVHLVLKL